MLKIARKQQYKKDEELARQLQEQESGSQGRARSVSAPARPSGPGMRKSVSFGPTTTFSGVPKHQLPQRSQQQSQPQQQQSRQSLQYSRSQPSQPQEPIYPGINSCGSCQARIFLFFFFF